MAIGSPSATQLPEMQPNGWALIASDSSSQSVHGKSRTADVTPQPVNLLLALTASVGIRFPFNLVLGIPIYYNFAQIFGLNMCSLRLPLLRLFKLFTMAYGAKTALSGK